MRKFALPILLSAILCMAPARLVAQSIDISLKGDGVKVVKVDKIIIVKEDRTVVQSFPIILTVPINAGLYFWAYPATVQATDRGDSLEIANAPKGDVTVSVKCVTANVDKDGKFIGFLTKFGSVTFTVGDVPTPTPPVPPNPPDPPKPDPPTPAPIPVAGFRVLFVEESQDRGKLTSGQFSTLFGKATRSWLDANCVKEGSQPGYRIYDKDQTAVGELKHWQDALTRPRQSIPWVIISNGVTGFEGPLPATEQGAMDLFKKYAGK